MPVTVLGGSAVYFGMCPDKPRLPEGWKYIERPDDWLKAESSEGEIYYVDYSRIIPCRIATRFDWLRTLPNYLKGGRPLKPGQEFADTRRVSILFSQLEPK